MSEIEAVGTVVVALIAIFSLISWVNKPFKESKKDLDEIEKTLNEKNRQQDLEMVNRDKRIHEMQDVLKETIQNTNKELIKPINNLTNSLQLMNKTLEGFGKMFEQQDKINMEIRGELKEITKEFSKFKSNCDRQHYYMTREKSE